MAALCMACVLRIDHTGHKLLVHIISCLHVTVYPVWSCGMVCRHFCTTMYCPARLPDCSTEVSCLVCMLHNTSCPVWSACNNMSRSVWCACKKACLVLLSACSTYPISVILSQTSKPILVNILHSLPPQTHFRRQANEIWFLETPLFDFQQV